MLLISMHFHQIPFDPFVRHIEPGRSQGRHYLPIVPWMMVHTIYLISCIPLPGESHGFREYGVP